MKPIKIMAHKVKFNLVKRISDHDENEAAIDTQIKEAEIGIMSDGGKRKPLSAVLVSMIHESGHEADFCTSHETFCDNDEEQRDMKESALEALSEVVAQILLDNNLLNEDWVQSLKDEINKVWRNDS